MKRLIALLLCLATFVCIFSACGKEEDEDMGAFVYMYLTDPIYNFDPAYAYGNESALKVIGLLYENLFTMGDDGKPVKSLVKKYSIDKEENTMLLTLRNDAFWTDGTPVSANDVVFTWQRVLDSSRSFEAAVLLYDVKNAKLAKEGDVPSIDDVGIKALNKSEIEIEFEDGFTNYDLFIRNLTSYALAPLRADALDRTSKEIDWAKSTTTIVTSGPFRIRELSYETENARLILERNAYYRRDYMEDKIDKSVKPYRLIIDYTMTDEEILAAYEAGEIFYIGDVPFSIRSAHSLDEWNDMGKVADSLSTHSYMINQNVTVRYYDANKFGNINTLSPLLTSTLSSDITLACAEKKVNLQGILLELFDAKGVKAKELEKDMQSLSTAEKTTYIHNKLAELYGLTADATLLDNLIAAQGEKIFANEKVRVALSTAIDRTTIANTVVFAEPANGLVPTGVFETDSMKNTFRNNDGTGLALDPSIDSAKALLQEASIDPSKFMFTISVPAYDDVHMEIAKMVQAAWGTSGLGFNVSINAIENVENADTAINIPDKPLAGIKDDLFHESYLAGTFEIAAIDYVALSTDAFSVLAPFAKGFTGGTSIISQSTDFFVATHKSGYNSEAYNEKIAAAYAEKDLTARAVLLHEAEDILMAEMPIIPVIYNKSITIVAKDLSKVETSYYQYSIFNKAKLKNYEDYLPEDDE